MKKLVKKALNELYHEEPRKEFIEELYMANTPKSIGIVIYYDLDKLKICCQPLPNDFIYSNVIYITCLPQINNLEGILIDEIAKINYISDIVEDLNKLEKYLYYYADGKFSILI